MSVCRREKVSKFHFAVARQGQAEKLSAATKKCLSNTYIDYFSALHRAFILVGTYLHHFYQPNWFAECYPIPTPSQHQSDYVKKLEGTYEADARAATKILLSSEQGENIRLHLQSRAFTDFKRSHP